MPQESEETNHCYESDDDSEQCKVKVAEGFAKRFHSTSCKRRRTCSENATSEQPINGHIAREVYLRRRAKSGDDSRHRNQGSHGKMRSHSGNLFWNSPHSYGDDKKPLLSHPTKLEICLDTFAQAARCTICNCTHSDESSCDTSCSSHCQSCEICQANGCPHFTSMQADGTDLKANHSDDTQKGVGLYHNNHVLYHRHTNDHLPDVAVCNGHAILEQQEQTHVLLEDDSSKAVEAAGLSVRKPPSKLRAYFGLFILLFANTLNYMDRYTIAGVLLDVKSFYGIKNNEVGLLQTSFIISYMVFSPIFGYMGDRYSRKLIMAVGIFFWSLITLGSSFIDADKFWLFLLMRALVGIGEASYSTIAPTIIADLYVGTARTKALSVFFFAIPVGSGLGYIAGSKFAHALGNWQWALRITPALGILCVLFILVIVREPQRGAAEGNTHLVSSSWGADLVYLMKHKSFMLSSAGFTCVAFIAGALALWTPSFMYYSIKQKPGCADESTVSMTFGLITCASGFVGVALGSWSASKLRCRWASRADPLVCAIGLIGCAPFLFMALYLSRHYTIVTWVLIFLGETLLSLNWALVTDILLYIVVPNRRATAEAVQILMSHALGDAGSPYLVGQVADMIAAGGSFPPYRAGQYLSLQCALYMCSFVAVLGGGFFLITSLYIQHDKAKAQATANLAKIINVVKVNAPGDPENAVTDLTISPEPVVT